MLCSLFHLTYKTKLYLVWNRIFFIFPLFLLSSIRYLDYSIPMMVIFCLSDCNQWYRYVKGSASKSVKVAQEKMIMIDLDPKLYMLLSIPISWSIGTWSLKMMFMNLFVSCMSCCFSSLPVINRLWCLLQVWSMDGYQSSTPLRTKEMPSGIWLFSWNFS